ncbi:MAG TPA: sigma factor-like helix-turn-helix DNA-binding protein, partial [Chloroflexota bacterium]|nr:sigma factor-like helix-turn-helix DNA-binding protein [Chloroflexota bacterium]
PSPELSALATEEHAQLIDAVRQLRAEDRAAIAGRYFLDLSEAEMAQTLGWPRGTVKSRLSRALARLRQGLVIGLVLLLLLAGAALGFSPEARSAIAERLGVNGILIRHIPADPAGPVDPSAGSLPGRTGPLVAPSSSGASPDAQIGAQFEAPHQSAAPSEGIGQHLHLGQQMSLEQAQQQVRFTIVQPHLPELGPPGAVYVGASPPDGQVSLVYAPRSSQSTTLPAGTGETGTRDVGLLFTQFRGRVQQDLVMKFLGPSTRLQAVRVNGSAGYWIEGTPHQFFYVDSMGQVRQETFRLAASTLLWTQGEMTFRLEGARSQEAALQIAASVG